MSGPFELPLAEVRTTTPYAIEVENTGEVQAHAVGDAIVVEGVQIPATAGARKLDDLTDVDGASAGLGGQALVKGVDGIWRPANVGGGGGPGGLVHLQPTPAASWSITHNLGRYPQVTVLDSDGNRVMPDLEYGSLNDVTLIHAAPLAGTAILT